MHCGSLRSVACTGWTGILWRSTSPGFRYGSRHSRRSTSSRSFDHTLRYGDSLLGLSRDQIEALDWSPNKKKLQRKLSATVIRGQIAKATELNRLIREAGSGISEEELQELLEEAQAETDNARQLGDLTLSAFFKGESDKERKTLALRVEEAVDTGDTEQCARQMGPPTSNGAPLKPFHWEIEFPEVFERENPGFDAVIGNPPFMGGRNISATQGSTYSKWLRTANVKSNGGADLVAHFFRRAFDLLREGGTLGLIATNTIAQGDTRAAGLRWICQNGGVIYRAQRRVKWPGLAAVVVSVVHIAKGEFIGEKRLDGAAAETITAFLLQRGGSDDPIRLKANSDKSFQGSIVLGMGFTFDDTDKKDIATPIAEMQRLIDENPNNEKVIFPYMGGEELNASPSQTHHRFAINFGEREENECRACWPSLMAIVEEKVKPERSEKDAKKYPRMVHEWWKYWNPRPGLQTAVKDLDCVLGVARLGRSWRSRATPREQGVRGYNRHLPAADILGILYSPSAASRDLGTPIGLVDEGRPTLHAIRLLRDVSLPRELAIPR